jgi:hypothetical protein
MISDMLIYSLHGISCGIYGISFTGIEALIINLQRRDKARSWSLGPNGVMKFIF